MKREISLVVAILCVLLTFTLPCFAEFQPDSNRWLWCGSTDERGIWLDSYSVYERPTTKGDIRVYIWALFYYITPTERIEKIQYAIDLKKRQFSIREYIKQDMKGNIVDWATNTSPSKSPIVPGTLSETLYCFAELHHLTYTQSHNIQ